ncbi:hypothetical protein L226DRAFT_530271 [Lentinus tigrinus ALCF2SS1-7]|nr:hypothetical protein L226DRAFT_530271 [Lentinus tigrinus ALCF2SS1-7]
MSRKPDPPFPSFTTVSYELQSDTLKLPAYRESFLLRYHPYPQTRRRNTTASLMKTMDCRYSEAPVAQGIQAASNPTCDEAANLAAVVHEVEADAGGPNIKRKRSLTSLIIDLAFLLRYKLRPALKAGTNA